MTNKNVILAIDEGTSGTRAATVSADGQVSCLQYAALHVDSPRPGVVEQDANDILDQTIKVCRATIADAQRWSTPHWTARRKCRRRSRRAA